LPSRRIAGALALAGALLPARAAAHVPFPGIEGFYAGVLHPLTAPPTLLALLALGMMLGHAWPQRTAVAWMAFMLCLLSGLVSGSMGAHLPFERHGLLLVAILAASLSALMPRVSPLPRVLLGGVGGLLLGAASAPDPGPWRAAIVTMTGSFVGAGVALFYVSGGIQVLRERFPQEWARIGLRIAAAWIAAVSCLMLALGIASSDTAAP